MSNESKTHRQDVHDCLNFDLDDSQARGRRPTVDRQHDTPKTGIVNCFLKAS
jgi:hypothetical protein